MVSAVAGRVGADHDVEERARMVLMTVREHQLVVLEGPTARAPQVEHHLEFGDTEAGLNSALGDALERQSAEFEFVVCRHANLAPKTKNPRARPL